MKLIKAYVRTFMVQKVIESLVEIGVHRLTVIDVRELGDEVDPEDLHISMEYGTKYTKMVKLELICEEKCVDRILELIVRHARTGHKGDGVVAVSPIERLIKVRTGEEVENGHLGCSGGRKTRKK